MPTQYPLNPPFPDGSWGAEGAIFVDGNIREWSADASPYFAGRERVKYKGLVYYLNYNWDGTTVGSPDSQVDANGVRVWTLDCYTSDGLRPIGQRRKTVNADSTYYYNFEQYTSIKGNWNVWHNITSAHSTVFELKRYIANNESGNGRTLLSLASTVEVSPLKDIYGEYVLDVQSINFNDANNIDNKMFAFITSSCGRTQGNASYVSPWGIFEYYGGFPYTTSYETLGTLIYEKAINYTLTTTNWVLNPEYDPTATTPFTYSYTYNGNTYTGSKDLYMIFTAETFLGRTYNGAFRVYRKGSSFIERYELDSVTPDLRTS